MLEATSIFSFDRHFGLCQSCCAYLQLLQPGGVLSVGLIGYHFASFGVPAPARGSLLTYTLFGCAIRWGTIQSVGFFGHLFASFGVPAPASGGLTTYRQFGVLISRTNMLLQYVAPLYNRSRVHKHPNLVYGARQFDQPFNARPLSY